MFVSTKKEILDYLKKQCMKFDKRNLTDFTANQVSKNLNISRNLASQYLNELSKENLVIKVNSRPVYFIPKNSIEKLYEIHLDTNIFLSTEELFKKLNSGKKNHKNFCKAIGWDLSISNCVEQCKAAIKYPPNGLPVLICGENGTGKSYLAQLMYEYAIDNKIISSDKKFISINCAEYSHRADILIKKIFGCVSLNENEFEENGLFLEADGGIVLLEEAQNINKSCQEKLFHFLDTGKYQPVGENTNSYSSTVKLIFATTERPEEIFLKNLLRRIPVIVNLPPLEARSMEEKEEMILSFFRHESKKTGYDITINSQIMNVLMDYSFTGNVGELKNCISTICANAFLHSNSKDGILNVNVYNLPESLLSTVRIEDSIQDKKFIISLNDYRKDSASEKILVFFDSLIDIFLEYKSGKKEFDKFLEASYERMNQYNDYLVFEKKYFNNKIKAMEKIIRQIVDLAIEKYPFQFSVNASLIISRVAYIQMQSQSSIHTWELKRKNEIKEFIEILTQNRPKETAVADYLIFLIRQGMDIELNGINHILLLLNILYYNRDIDLNQIAGIIISHGYSTASSIADAANQLIGSRVFEAVDMTLDTQVYDVALTVRKYMQQMYVNRDIIFLVDMGSLEDIDKELKDFTNINIGVINNISTALAVDVGFKICQKLDMEEILKTASQSNVCTYKLIRSPNREKAILFTSEAGTQVADRMRDLFVTSMPKSIPIHMVSYDYFRLMRNGREDEIFKKYEVMLIVGVFNPDISDIPFIAVADVVREMEIMKRLFTNYLQEDELEKFHGNMLKNFSLQNVVKYLTILNPDKVLDMVQQALDKLQKSLGNKFSGKTIVGMYIHLSCLIERLVTKTPIENYQNIEQFVLSKKDFIEKVTECFKDVTKHYNISIPVSEIAYIYDYIRHDKDEPTDEEQGEL